MLTTSSSATTASGRPAGTTAVPPSSGFLGTRRSKKQVDAKGFTLMTLPYLQELAQEQKGYRTPELNDNLYLHYKGFAQITDAIVAYSGLKSLWLEGNALSAMDHLHLLPNLRCLYLQENCLESIPVTPTSHLAGLTQLRILNLSNNMLTALPAELALLPSLSSLHASNNKLGPAADAIAVLKDCAALSVLDLHHNNLQDPECVTQVLWNMPQLAVLTLHHNPVLQSLVQYRRSTIVHVRTLTFLDDRPVSDNERRATDAWAEGGLEAERAEQQRQRDEEKNEQRRNYEALAKLQAENRAKRREREGEWSDHVPSVGFQSEGLKRMYDDMVEKGLGVDQPAASASSSSSDGNQSDNENDDDDDQQDLVPDLEAANQDDLADGPSTAATMTSTAAAVEAEPEPLVFSANRAPPVRAPRAMDVAGTKLDAGPLLEQPVNTPAQPATRPMSKLIQEVDDEIQVNGENEHVASNSFTPLAELLGDEDENDDDNDDDGPIEQRDSHQVSKPGSAVESLLSIVPPVMQDADKGQDLEQDEPLRPLVMGGTQPSRRAWIEELPDVDEAKSDPVVALPEHKTAQLSNLDDDDGNEEEEGGQDLGDDPYQIRAFRRRQRVQQRQHAGQDARPGHPSNELVMESIDKPCDEEGDSNTPEGVETDLADVTLTDAELVTIFPDEHQAEPIVLPATTVSSAASATSSSMPTPLLSPEYPPAPTTTPIPDIPSMSGDSSESIVIPRAIRAGIAASSSRKAPNLRISLPPQPHAFQPPQCPSTPTPTASGVVAPPGTPATAGQSSSSSLSTSNVSTPPCMSPTATWEALIPRAPHSTPVCESFTQAVASGGGAFSGTVPSSVWSELGGGARPGSPQSDSGTRAPVSTPVSETFSPLALSPLGPPTPTRRQSSSSLLRKVLGSPALSPMGATPGSGSGDGGAAAGGWSGMSSPLAMTLDPEDVESLGDEEEGDGNGEPGSLTVQAGSERSASSLSSASTCVPDSVSSHSASPHLYGQSAMPPNRAATPVLDRGDHGLPTASAIPTLVQPKPDRNRKGLRLIPNLGLGSVSSSSGGAGAIAPPSTPVPITPTRVLSMVAPDTPVSAALPRAPVSTPVAGGRVGATRAAVEPRVAMEAARRVFNAQAMRMDVSAVANEPAVGREDRDVNEHQVSHGNDDQGYRQMSVEHLEEQLALASRVTLLKIDDDLEWDESSDDDNNNDNDWADDRAQNAAGTSTNGVSTNETGEQPSLEQEIEDQVHHALVEQVRMVEVVGPSFALGGDGGQQAEPASRVSEVNGDEGREEPEKDVSEIGLAWGEEAQV